MIETILLITLGVTTLSIILVLIRFLIGPGIANRMVAFDVMTVGTIGFIAVLSSVSNRFIYVDVAIVYGILSFIGVIVVAKFIEKNL